MGDDAFDASAYVEHLREKDLRIQELERCLAETTAALDVLVEKHIDAEIRTGNTIPLLLHHAQQVLQRRHEELERIVAERTGELEQANVQLTRELDERRRLEERFHAIWDIATDAMVLSDSRGIVIAANPAYFKLHGYNPEEIIDQDFSIIYPEGQRGTAREAYLKVFHSPASQPMFSATIQRKDGDLRRVETRIGFLTGEGERSAMLSVIRDITEQVLAEAAAEKEHKRAAWTARLPDENPDPVARISLDGILRYRNQAFVSVFGPDFSVGKEVPDSLRTFLVQASPPKNETEGEIQIGDRSYLVKVVALPGEGYANIYVRDITARRAAQEALKQAHDDLFNERNRLLAVMEALPVGLAIYDTKGGVLQANQSFEEVWGSPRPPANSVADYALYQAWWVETGEQVKPEDWAAARAVQTGETVTGQFIRIARFDGSEGYIINSGAPVRDAEGRIIGATVAIMDITGRVRAETELRESQGRFRVALASAPILVFNCDRDLRYTWISQALPGLGPGEAIGKRDEELAPESAVQELVAAKQWVLFTGQSLVREISLKFKGEMRYFVLAMEPVRDEKGELTGITGSAIEISEQKRLENEQKEKEIQAEIQRRLMGYREKERLEIAQEMHDGPIQLLAGTIFLLQATRESIPDRSYQVEIEQALANLKASVRELRDIMNELRPPAVIRFGLAKSARMHAEDFRDRHPKIRLELKAFEDGTLLHETVRLALFRIFQESLSNISKHAGATRVWVRFSKKGGKVHLIIRDNGTGFQVQPDLVGLTQLGHYGLAGMKERAEAIGGAFQVISDPGKGTTIHVTAPIEGGIPAAGG